MKRLISLFFVAALIVGCNSGDKTGNKIDRLALVSKHNPHVTSIDSLSALTVGNGGFAFTADITGLQTFPEVYKGGVCLTTQADWAWYSTPNYMNFKLKDLLNKNGYATPGKSGESKERSDYFTANAHRYNLGRIGFSGLDQSLISDAEQNLDLYNGVINSSFKHNGKSVKVTTSCNPISDMLAVKINSEELLPVTIAFTYPSSAENSDGGDWESKECRTELITEKDCAIIKVKNHLSRYCVRINLKNAYIRQPKHNLYEIIPLKNDWSFTSEFSSKTLNFETASAELSIKETKAAWNSFWQNSGAVDLSGSSDPRAAELERRIVLSQYLTAVQCASDTPASSRGLTGNSNYGKFRLDEYWWAQAHFALWGQPDKVYESLQWLQTSFANAERTALAQGYNGVRWPSVSSLAGEESPSDSDVYSIAHQAQIIYLTDLIRRAGSGSMDVVYETILKATASFINDYPKDNSIVCQPLQKSLGINAKNPSYELAAWRYAVASCDKNLQKDFRNLLLIRDLSAMPVENGLYLPAEGVKNAYTDAKYTSGHPSVLGVLGMLPGNAAVDTATMKNTLDKVLECWDWDSCCGYDYAMAAMCATRLGESEKALDILMMDAASNKWLANGHNRQSDMSCCYLPGNGALLSAVALMVAGWDGCEIETPGFPKNGKWDIKWEGIKPLP